RDLPDFADFGCRWIIEPISIPDVGEKIPVQEKVDVAPGIDIPDLAAVVSRQEVRASGQEPNAAHLPKTSVSRQVAVPAAAGETIAGNYVAAAAVWCQAINTVGLPVCHTKVAVWIDSKVAEFNKAARKRT